MHYQSEVDSNEVATADDIASLFSTVNSAIKEVESLEDIAVLFDSVKSTEAAAADEANSK